MSRKVLLYRIELPAHLKITRAQAENVSSIRKYASMKRRTLPGDIRVEVTEAEDGGWRIDVFEDPDTEVAAS